MRYRISGETLDGSTFTTRVEAPNAIAAVGTFRTMLAESGKADADVAVVRAKVSTSRKASINFGAKREKKASKPATPAAPSKPVTAPNGGKK